MVCATFSFYYCSQNCWQKCEMNSAVNLIFVSRRTECQEEKPLEFEDIVDKKTYDKMRPPKPGGMRFI